MKSVYVIPMLITRVDEEFVKSKSGEWLMDAANVIGNTNDIYAAKHRLIIHVSGVGHIQRTCLAEFRYI